MKAVLFVVLLVIAAVSCQENAGPCEICKTLVGFVENYLEKGETVEKIEKELEKVCALLPGKTSESCDLIVEKYVPTIISFIEEEIPPKRVCELIGLCDTNVVDEIEDGLDKCEICTYVTTIAKRLILEEVSEEKIVEELGVYCDMLKPTAASLCKIVVKDSIDHIFKFIQEKTPEEMCQMIKLCKVQKDEIEAIKLDGCSLCEWLAKMVEDYLADAKTEEEILFQLHKLCKLLPESYAGLCKTMVDQYLTTIIEYLEEEYPPHKLCTVLGMCEEVKREPVTDGSLSCIKKCLKKKYDFTKIIALVAMCGTDLSCYKSNVSSDVFNCITGCL